MPDESSLHRALAEPHRRRLLDALRESESPLDVAELASRLGLHSNTVRWHLGVLADAGLVTSQPLDRDRPGRPRIGYAAAPDDDAGGGAAERESYRLLATILAGAAESGESPFDAGRAWGRYLVARPEPFTEADAVGEVVELLAAQGFAPEGRPAEICMHRCPFRDLAETHGRVVCGVHAGLVDGALAELGAPERLASLEPFVEPELCVARLVETPRY